MTFVCLNPACSVRSQDQEISIDDHSEWPRCQGCGARLKGRAPGVVFTGEISGRYLDRSCRPEAPGEGGHWVWRVKTSRSGRPERDWINSWSEHRRYVREEGFRDPYEMPTYATISEDGRRIIEISKAEARDIHEAILRGYKLPVRKPGGTDEAIRVEPAPVTEEIKKEIEST